jgi:hypothetical protein
LAWYFGIAIGIFFLQIGTIGIDWQDSFLGLRLVFAFVF